MYGVLMYTCLVEFQQVACFADAAMLGYVMHIMLKP
jgi:hypothetical protein